MIGIVIGTYGAESWRDLAMSRAYPSVLEQAQDELPTFQVHGPTLAAARNTGAEQAVRAGADWLCFVDADDELAPGYLKAIRQAIHRRAREQPMPLLMLTPRVEYVIPQGGDRVRTEPPRFWPEVPPERGNWMVIGTVVPAGLFRAVGGFEEWPMYEDWALFARMQKQGGTPVRVPRAVYRAWRNPRGRNHQGPNASRQAFDMIHRAVWPELHEEE